MTINFKLTIRLIVVLIIASFLLSLTWLPSLAFTRNSPIETGEVVTQSSNVLTNTVTMDEDEDRKAEEDDIPIRNVSTTTGSLAPQGETGALALGTVVTTFTLTNPTGLEHDGQGNLYVTDTGLDEVFLADVSGAVISSTVLTTTGNPIGVTTDGSNIFITDTNDDEVEVYTLAGTFVYSFSVAGQSAFPEGITYNPRTGNLYMVDGDFASDFNGGDHIFEYTLAGTLLSTYTLATTSTDGIAYDPQRCNYWVYASGDDSITHYNPVFSATEIFSGTVNAGFDDGEGVAVINNELYVVAAGASDTVLVFDIAGAQNDCDKLYLPIIQKSS